MIYKNIFDVFLIRHIYFIIRQTILCIANSKKYFYNKNSYKIFSQLYLFIIHPYLNFYLSKFKKKHPNVFKLKISENLDKLGFSYLPKIDLTTIDFIKFNKQKNRIFKFHEINFEKAFKFAEKNGFHKLAKDYLGQSKVNFDVMAWNTLPFDKEFATTTWHQDRDGFKLLKIFIYLDDTDADSGPHKFAIGSHKPQTLRFLPLIRYKDHDVKKYYNSFIEYTGKKGTCFAEDTRGLHRGTPPKRNERSILQFVYYIAPIRWTRQAVEIQI